jgi:hypothetical protein
MIILDFLFNKIVAYVIAILASPELLFFVLSPWYLFFYVPMGNAIDRRSYVNNLEKEASLRLNYALALSNTLKWVDRHTRSKRSPPISGFNTWTTKGFSKCFFLALFYPAISFLLVWSFNGVNLSGITGLLPAGLSSTQRTGIAISSVLIAIWAFRAGRIPLLVNALLCAGMLSVLYFTAGNVDNPLLTSIYAILFGCSVGFVCGLLGDTLSQILDGLFNYLTGDKIHTSIFFVFITTTLIVFMLLEQMSLWFGGTGVVLVPVVFVTAFLSSARRKEKKRFNAGYWVVMCLLAIPAVLLLSSLAPSEESFRARFAFALFFVILLPIVNAIWDWISFGFTRALVQRVIKNDFGVSTIVLMTFFDLVSAFFFLTGLSFMLTATIAFSNVYARNSSGNYLVDFNQIFYAFQNSPLDSSVWWIYITLFSTFLPTFLHVVIIFSALLVTITPVSVKNYFIGLLNHKCDTSARARIIASLFFAFRYFFPMALAGLAFFLLIFTVVVYVPGLAKWIHYSCNLIANEIDPDTRMFFSGPPSFF